MPAGEARDTVVRLRMTLGERDALEQAAGAAGLTISDYIRSLIARPSLDGSPNGG